MRPAPAATTGDSHARLLAELTRFAAEVGYRWEVTDTGEAERRCFATRKLIEISERLEPNGQLAAGVHEVAHALIALDYRAPQLSYPRRS
jgi:hypothetical protein